MKKVPYASKPTDLTNPREQPVYSSKPEQGEDPTGSPVMTSEEKSPVVEKGKQKAHKEEALTEGIASIALGIADMSETATIATTIIGSQQTASRSGNQQAGGHSGPPPQGAPPTGGGGGTGPLRVLFVIAAEALQL